MKKLLIGSLMLTASVIAYAQDTTMVQPPILPSPIQQEISRERIQVDDLPEAVKEELKKPDYGGWTVDAAYKSVMSESESPESERFTVYIIEFKRRDERAVLKFDKNGKKLDDDNDK